MIAYAACQPGLGEVELGLEAGPGTGTDADVGSGSDAGMGSGSDAGMGSGSDAGMGSGSDAGMGSAGLAFQESTLTLVPQAIGTATVIQRAGPTDRLRAASLSDSAFQFLTSGCSGMYCDFTPSPRTLPQPLMIRCVATDGVEHEGVVTAFGIFGASDVAVAVVRCTASQQATLDVSPSEIVVSAPVLGAVGRVLSIANNGTAPLEYMIEAPAGPDWSLPGPGPCAPGATCTQAPMVPPAIVPVRFAPTAPGPSVAAVTVASSVGTRTVALIGTGVGSRLGITEPTARELDFGTIPRGAVASRALGVTAVGNREIAVSASASGSPFAVAPAGHTLAPGSSAAFMVSCSSPVPLPQQVGAIALTAPAAYALDASAITVRCRVANTAVAVTPAAFDFREVRGGSPAPEIPFTIENPGPSAATVTSIDLVGAPTALELAVEGGPLPRPLGPGAAITGRLTLSTRASLDLATTAPRMQIGVDAEQLVYPVSGRVTTPAAYVTPERLELGTACAGVPVRATVSLVNSGTARLAVEPPLLDPSFVAQPESPTSYPAPLAAGATAILGIAPAAREPGPYAGKLTWRADAPAAPFVVPVSLTYIETGTAISPARLSFAPIQVTETSPRFTVTLQNCNTAPVVVSIDGIKADRGGAAAWQVVPSAERRLLAPQERLALSVAFSPRRHGRHAARIELVIGGEPASVALEGDGIDASFERTSFYACSCGGGEAPGGGAIALAAGVAAAVLRRRRPRRDRAAPMRSAR